MVRLLHIIAFFIVYLGIGSCKKDRLDPYFSIKGDQYFVLKPGMARLYRVDSIHFQGQTGKKDTFNYSVKEQIDTFFTDNMGERAARIELYYRILDTLPWKIYKVVYAKVNKDFAERVEDNRRYLKMMLPPNEESLWNLNQRNDLDRRFLHYSMLEKPYKSKYLQADSSIKVQFDEVVNEFEEYRYEEVYAKGIGLLFARRTDKQVQLGRLTGYDVTYHLYDIEE